MRCDVSRALTKNIKAAYAVGNVQQSDTCANSRRATRNKSQLEGDFRRETTQSNVQRRIVDSKPREFN